MACAHLHQRVGPGVTWNCPPENARPTECWDHRMFWSWLASRSTRCAWVLNMLRSPIVGFLAGITILVLAIIILAARVALVSSVV